MSKDPGQYFRDMEGASGTPVRVLWDDHKGEVQVWFTDFPLAKITIDLIPEETEDYLEQVYAQTMLILNLYDILTRFSDPENITQVSDFSGESTVTDESIRAWLNQGDDNDPR